MAYFKRSGKITTNSINKKIDFNRKTTNNPPSPVVNTTGLFSSSFVDDWNRHLAKNVRNVYKFWNNS